MLTAYQKYCIKRNKTIQKWVADKIQETGDVREALKSAAENIELHHGRQITLHTVTRLFYDKSYPHSPLFEYDEEGNILWCNNSSGHKIEGTETEHFKSYLASINVTSKSA